MMLNWVIKFAGMLSIVTAIPQLSHPRAFLAGDSTMCYYAPDHPAKGWGQYLSYSLNIPVTNNAIGGRSARSFTAENRFRAIFKKVVPGDIVIIEFGHNDGGNPAYDDTGRADCPGTGLETTCMGSDNSTVRTFDAYISAAAITLANLGAYVVISSQTPVNPWDPDTGLFRYQPSVFVAGAKLAVKEVDNENVTFVDHGKYAAEAYKRIGEEMTTGQVYLPNDRIHTAAKGADVLAIAFIKAVLCGDNPLKEFVLNGTSDVAGDCLNAKEAVVGNPLRLLVSKIYDFWT